MRTLGLFFTQVLAANAVFAATLHLDDFQNGTALGWSGASPMAVTGGPAGDDDIFLRVISNGENGPGSHAAVFNLQPVWVGDYTESGAAAIEFDMVNFDMSASGLDMRVVLFGPDHTGNRWTSVESQIVPNDSVWRHYSFSIAESELINVQGVATYDSLMGDVVRVMLRHDSGAPSALGSPIAARLGVDNIALVGNETLRCDFDDDGTCAGPDIDSLMRGVATASNDARLDLTGDRLVDDADRDAWLALAGPENGFTGPFLVGDANLDGTVGAEDLNAVGISWQTDNADWTKGNFTNGDTNSADLNELGINWQERVPTVAENLVPEPALCQPLLLTGFGFLLSFRRIRTELARG